MKRILSFVGAILACALFRNLARTPRWASKCIGLPLVIIAPFLFITATRAEMAPDPKNSGAAKTITLMVGETQVVFNELMIRYSSYGHEHASYSPGESFAATVGVYVFLLSGDDASESITLYRDARVAVHDQKSSEPTSWKNYSITLMDSSEDQQTVVLGVARRPRA